MAAFGKKLRVLKHGQVMFFCPGCRTSHGLRIRDFAPPEVKDVGQFWGFNGSGDAPTFTPSVLVRGGHYAHGETPGNCYCDYAVRYPDKEPISGKCFRCHSFVTDGRIQFLGDCTHNLAGQTVDLPDFPGNGEA